MTTSQALVAFVFTAGLMTMIPGMDTALILRTAAVEGSRRAIHSALGICTGVLIWGVIVALGLGALLAASELAYTILRWAGAAYLCYLGLGMLLRPRKAFRIDDSIQQDGQAKQQRWFIRGMFTNLLNPKVGVFYVTFLPQFVPSGANVPAFTLLFAAIHALEGILWFSLLTLATRPLTKVLRRPRTIRTLDQVTGAVLIGFGIRLGSKAVGIRSR
jgi:RhtB (resistance to homoserine/threonine) family protein